MSIVSVIFEQLLMSIHLQRASLTAVSLLSLLRSHEDVVH